MTQTYKVQVSMNQAHLVDSGFTWKQGDFGFNIEIEVLDFDTTGATPSLVFRKGDGAVEATTGITVSNNKFTYAIRGNELETPGPCICDLKLKNSTTQRISTASFKYFVLPDTEDGLNNQAHSYSDTIAQIISGYEDDVETINANIAPAYSTSATYNVGDYVIYNNSLYKCKTAITTAEAWTSAHWTQAVVSNDVDDIKNVFINNELNNAQTLSASSQIPIRVTWEQGSRNGAAPIDSDIRIRAKDFFPIKAYRTITISPLTGYKFELDYYGADGSYINRYGSGWTTDSITLDLNASTFNDVYFMSILLAKTDNSTIFPSDSANIHITAIPLIFKDIKQAKNLGTSTNYNLGSGSSGYVNINNGTIGFVDNAYHSGKIQINGSDRIAVKNSFRYNADGIALYDRYENFITGYGLSSFTDDYLIIDLPINAYSFDVTWYTGLPAAVVDYYGKIENYLEGKKTSFSNVENDFISYSSNVFNKWLNPTLTLNSNGTATYTTPQTGNTGFYGHLSNYDSKTTLHLFLNFTATDNSKLKLYAFGTSKENVAGSFFNLDKSFSAGENEYILDVNWLDVYGTLDVSKPFTILVANDTRTGGICTIQRFEIGVYETEPDDVFGKTLIETISNIKEKLNEETDVVAETNYIISPNGTKYIMQIKDDLSQVFIPVVPTKAMFFGNSLLLGFNEDYGIETDPYGMAASDKNHDYYAFVNGFISNLNANYTVNKMRTSWESSTTDNEYRAFTNQMLAMVDANTDLIVIQLGDNINTAEKKAVFPTNAKNLLTEMRGAAPNARIVWVGSWFNSTLIESVMPNICADTGCEFISISDLYKPENQNVVGGKYYDSNGGEHTIESSGVASHPSSNGFKAIANRILYKLGLTHSTNEIN